MHREKWNARYEGKGQAGPSEPSGPLIEETRLLKPGRALDLAAGDGRNALYLAGTGWDVTAVDFSEVAVERGKRFAEELGVSVRWEVHDITKYVPPEQEYDLVCLFYFHIPWHGFRSVLQRASAAVRPGGNLLVVGHDRSNLEAGGSGPRNPEALYTFSDIVGELSGFAVERTETLRHAADHGPAGAGTVQVDCIVRARRVDG
jgi:SAM-dependent methyltransferase